MKPLKLELNQSVWRSWAKTWAQTPENDLAEWWGEVRVEEKPFTHLLYFDTVEWPCGALPRAPPLVNMPPIFCSRQWGLARGPAHWFWIPSRPVVIYSAPSFTSLCKLPGLFEESFCWAQTFDTLEKRILGNTSQARQLRPLGLYNYLPATSGLPSSTARLPPDPQGQSP